MSTIELDDESLFGNIAAEDEEPQVFDAYYWDRPEYSKFLNPSKRFAIINTYRGEGKSAVLRATYDSLLAKHKNSAVLIKCTGSDITPRYDGEDPVIWIQEWKKSMFLLIARNLGGQVGFAWTDDGMSLVNEAETCGFKQKSLLSAILSRVNIGFSIGTDATGIKLGQKEPDRGKKELEKIVQRYAHAPIWLFIDDIDENFQNTNAWKAKLAGFFTSCRYMFNAVPELRIRCGLRPTVSTHLDKAMESLGKATQYMIKIHWGEDDIRALLAKRVEAYLTRTGKSIKNRYTQRAEYEKMLINMIFEDNMRWSADEEGQQKRVNAYKVLSKLSRGRPRWLISLCLDSAKQAAIRGATKITFKDINNCLEDYGRSRVHDLESEYKSQCPQVVELIEAFTDQKKRYKTDELYNVIKNRILGPLGTVQIIKDTNIQKTKSPRDIAAFLYEIGFISARRIKPDGHYEHFEFTKAPNMLINRTNPDAGMEWEIHPIFHGYLRTLNSVINS